MIICPGSILASLSQLTNGLLHYASERFGPEAPRRLQAMQLLIRGIEKRNGPKFRQTLINARALGPEMDSLNQINDFFNKQPYYSDLEHWGVDDYWATPVEFVASLGGDCEDYAIAKYMSLKEIGVPIERMRITYVRAVDIGETHMVLAYYPTPEADPLILDNLIPEIKPASQRRDLIPVYSFNDDDLWLPNGSTRKGGATTVRLWQGVIDKMAKENKM